MKLSHVLANVNDKDCQFKFRICNCDTMVIQDQSEEFVSL